MTPNAIGGFSIAAMLTLVTAAPDAAPQLMGRHNKIVNLLVQDAVVFGWIAPDVTPASAKRAARDRLMDFVDIDMAAPARFDPSAIHGFEQAMLEAGLNTNPNERPIAVELPPLRADPVAARQRVSEMLNIGAHAIVFHGIDTADDAARAINSMRYVKAGAPPDQARADGFGEAPGYWGMPDEEYMMRADVYPLNRSGDLAAMVLIDSEAGIANSTAIAKLRPTVVLADAAALRRAMKDDAAKVEAAIETLLASCTRANVACGITANAADVAQRIAQGFRVILIADRDYAETIKKGRARDGGTPIARRQLN